MTLTAGVTNRIIFVRHGEPDESARGRCYGKSDIGLSENGRRQIWQTAGWLEKFDVKAIYASPRVRATESARIIAEKFGLIVKTENRFAEMDFGDFEGLTYDAVKELYPDLYECWMNTPTKVEFPNGGSFPKMRKEVLEAVNDLKKIHAGETVAVVSHGGVNRIVLSSVLELRDENLFRLEQNYACANVVDFYGDFPVVRIINHNFGNL